jgi:drug/metabolite transporter (DMT)-like permease
VFKTVECLKHCRSIKDVCHGGPRVWYGFILSPDFVELTRFMFCRIISDHFLLVSGIVAMELLTVLLYLWSLKFLFVSYAVAAKRSGILLSVISGSVFFGERIRDKLAYILLMMGGMLLIVLAPDMKYNLHLRHP